MDKEMNKYMNEDCILNSMSHIINAQHVLSKESIDRAVKTYHNQKEKLSMKSAHEDFNIITLHSPWHHPLYVRGWTNVIGGS